MRISRDSSRHLTYCTNIHPGEDWNSVFQNLQTYIPALKQRVSPDTAFGIGLRLSSLASEQLLAGNHLLCLQDWLAAEDCYIFTLNGFPYGGFHQQAVKDKVYAPDWSTRPRLRYTQRLVTILAALMPRSVDGGISTVPLSYKPWYRPYSEEQTIVFEESSLYLAEMAAELARIENATGKLLHLDLEPEPDALLENADEVIAFFQEWLLPIGCLYLQKRHGILLEVAERWLRRHIRICYDTCHFAVEYEDPTTALAKFKAAGIEIGKVQLSSAIRIPIPTEPAQRACLQHQLEPFAESTYLHQVIEQRSPGTLHHYPDLSDALSALAETPAIEWRTHFHVPLFIDRYPPFESTRDHITTVLEKLPQFSDCTHFEIETYTWDVLPSEMKLDVLTSIHREYEWVLATLSKVSATAVTSALSPS
ncbi:metabolite traffic protein EboE [Oscillatoria sp. CS-180]|uniref:metabolite traffic protein EboE n=1 Tax=Oscillatoria sp. CS-180 TaxID=3021720 RepID=UPI002330BCF6|nr:metabolite traffic protein EboE [Oscillatoria sp. CS-180]MDB9528026.1 metabolite traffic protein EboE [Oscillatoria sp. CS-180]